MPCSSGCKNPIQGLYVDIICSGEGGGQIVGGRTVAERDSIIAKANVG